MYEMCMLKHAFESTSLLGLVYKIVSESYDPIPEVYSEGVDRLVRGEAQLRTSKRQDSGHGRFDTAQVEFQRLATGKRKASISA